MVEFQERYTKADISSTCYAILQSDFPFVRAEVKHRTPGGQRNFRFDLVVYDENKKALFVVECKRGYKNKDKKDRIADKTKRYRKALNIPVYQIRGAKGVAKLRKIISKYWHK